MSLGFIVVWSFNSKFVIEVIFLRTVLIIPLDFLYKPFIPVYTRWSLSRKILFWYSLSILMHRFVGFKVWTVILSIFEMLSFFGSAWFIDYFFPCLCFVRSIFGTHFVICSGYLVWSIVTYGMCGCNFIFCKLLQT